MGFEGKEKLKMSFDQAIESGKKTALNLIRERFEYAENPDDNLEYHNTQHTENIVARVKIILEAIERVNGIDNNERLVKIGELAGAWHDSVQEYNIQNIHDGSFTKKIRQRFVKKNEENSAKEALEYMSKTEYTFTDEEESLVRQAIDATVSAFDIENKTVVQSSLTKESSLVARAVALADIGTAGMCGTNEFLYEGNAVFREENMDIKEALQHMEDLSDDKKEFFRNRMISWSESQEGFALGRKALLDTELEGLSKGQADAVKVLFNKFDASAEGARANTVHRKEMSFEELARDFGYPV